MEGSMDTLGRWTGGMMGGQIDEWVVGWTDGRMDGWINKLMYG